MIIGISISTVVVTYTVLYATGVIRYVQRKESINIVWNGEGLEIEEKERVGIVNSKEFLENF